MKQLFFAFVGLACSVHAAIDPSDFDPSVPPSVDFFQYVNGGWLKKTPIPPGESRWGSFDELEMHTREHVRDLCAAAAAKGAGGSALEQIVGNFFASGMDVGAINAAGLGPIQAELDHLATLRSAAEVWQEIGHLHALGVPVAFGFSAVPDVRDNRRNLATLAQDALGLPERDYYLTADPHAEELRRKYLAHMGRMFVLIGEAPAEAGADAASVLELETSLARNQLSREALRRPGASYNRQTVATLSSLTSGLDWESFFREAGAPSFSELNVAEPEYFQSLGAELKTRPIGQWRALLRWQFLRTTAPYLAAELAEENFAFYQRVLWGTKTPPPRWRSVIDQMDRAVSDAVGQIYVAAYFPPESKVRVRAMAENVRAALRARLHTLEWMDEPTRQRAISKLNAMRIRIGYPDAWRDYTSLRIDRGAYVSNVLRATAFNHRHNLSGIGQPVEDEWKLTTLEIRGTNMITRNEILFPAGFLQPPLFDPKADDALNYGGIGAVIGHEITHGFDDQGRLFDENGNLANWWTPESARRFQERAAAIVRQFDAYTVLDGLHLNGTRSQGENIADLGGVKLGYYAFMQSRSGESEVLLDGFKPAQRYFINWAIIRRGKMLPEAQRLRVATDPHAPPEFRTNAPLSNLDEFAAAFSVPEGAPMRRPPEDRVVIW